MGSTLILPGSKFADFAFGRPTVATLKALGFQGVGRYFSSGTSGKNLTDTEIKTYHDGGLYIVPIWETYETAPLKGAPQGKIDGAIYRSMLTKKGVPSNVPCVVAFDLNVFRDNVVACMAYYNAFELAVMPYKVGPYGDLEMLK